MYAEFASTPIMIDPPTVDPMTAHEFRGVMGAVCTPVSVVTAFDDGRPHGTTVSAFSSLSLNPPMVLVALDLSSALLGIIEASGRFGVNVLAADQSGLALTFARKGDNKFSGVQWGVDHGLPRIHGVTGWLACEVDQLVPGGDHVVAFARVIAAGHRRLAPPLLYHRSAFGTHSMLR